MRPTTATPTAVIDLRPHIHANALYDHPKDVLSDATLTTEDKRSLLASWASDASAVESCPVFRAPPELRRPVMLKDILLALAILDRSSAPEPPGGQSKRLGSVSKVNAGALQ